MLPQHTIGELARDRTGIVDAILADGSIVSMSTYSCSIRWFDEWRQLEVVANEGDYPLLGVGLLLDLQLIVDYRSRSIRLG